MTLSLTLFAVAFTLAATWLVLVARLVGRLHAHDARTWETLGRPVVRMPWWRVPADDGDTGEVLLSASGGGVSVQTLYTPRELGALFRLLGFVLRGGRDSTDTEACRLARRLRVIALLVPSLLVGVVASAILLEPVPAATREPVARAVEPAAAPISTGSGLQQVVLRAGLDLYRAGRHAEAVDALDRAVALDPGDAATWYWRGLAHEKLARFDAALRDLRAAVRLQPDLFNALLHIDWLLAKRSDWAGIVALWSAYLERNPAHARAWYERGGAHHRAGHRDLALADARRACELGHREACTRL